MKTRVFFNHEKNTIDLYFYFNKKQDDLFTNHIQMPIKTKIDKSDLQELRDHRDNTAWELIKAYTLAQISFMDWIDTRTVKTSWRYLPIRVDTWESLGRFKIWKTKKPYMIRYIRLDEIKAIYSKRNKWKKLTSI